MASVHLFATLILSSLVYAIYEIYELEVSPGDFAIQHRLEVEAEPHRFFQFLVQEDSLEKFLPWLTRLKEADTRIMSAGKNYRAFLKLPILGMGKIELTVTEYRPANLLILESSDTTTQQRIKLRVRRYQNHTVLRTSIHLRKTSAVYHVSLSVSDFSKDC
ncbi:uncharacterized protein [Venturia canescens]|uniref:uncharacterized protein isoform X2 n=1 Tax=Venturia canescens TaxID=32260 RepID=UPI001C9D5AFE|nr:uncharacterized protein LOC122409325 isoform X2 [Venturia canescens]